VFIVGQRLWQRPPACQTALDRFGEQFRIVEGVADPMRQDRIFEMTCVPNQRLAWAIGFPEKVGEIPSPSCSLLSATDKISCVESYFSLFSSAAMETLPFSGE
jgi:hypothetical protein